MGMKPASNTPVVAPAVVATSSTMASRMLGSPAFSKDGALAQEHAITDIRLAPIAV